MVRELRSNRAANSDCPKPSPKSRKISSSLTLKPSRNPNVWFVPTGTRCSGSNAPGGAHDDTGATVNQHTSAPSRLQGCNPTCKSRPFRSESNPRAADRCRTSSDVCSHSAAMAVGMASDSTDGAARKRPSPGMEALLRHRISPCSSTTTLQRSWSASMDDQRSNTSRVNSTMHTPKTREETNI